MKLSELIQGLEVTIQGDANCIIKGVSTIQEAEPNRIAFLMNPAYRKFLATTKASAVILTEAEAKNCPVTAVITSNPYYVYAKIAAYFDNHPKTLAGIHPTVVIGKDCKVSPTASVGPHCVLGDGVTLGDHVVLGAGCVIGEYTEIGDQTRLDANVTLYHRIKVGKRVLILSGAVIGSDGFGLAKSKGSWHRVPQLGTVILEDDVEVGANTTIDRGAIDNTVISKGVKLDNQIQIGHNVYIGENTAIAGCVGIAGSSTIGKNCMMGGGSGMAGHVTLGDNVVVTGMTGVTKSLLEPGVYSGFPPVPNAEWRKTQARISRLKQLTDRIKALEAILEGEKNI